jgi:hypothetical protein
MSQKVRFWSTAVFAGIVAGGAAALLLAPHSDRGVPTRAGHSHPAENSDPGEWSGPAAGSGVSVRTLPPAPMGWY